MVRYRVGFPSHLEGGNWTVKGNRQVVILIIQSSDQNLIAFTKKRNHKPSSSAGASHNQNTHSTRGVKHSISAPSKLRNSRRGFCLFILRSPASTYSLAFITRRLPCFYAWQNRKNGCMQKMSNPEICKSINLKFGTWCHLKIGVVVLLVITYAGILLILHLLPCENWDHAFAVRNINLTNFWPKSENSGSKIPTVKWNYAFVSDMRHPSGANVPKLPTLPISYANGTPNTSMQAYKHSMKRLYFHKKET